MQNLIQNQTYKLDYHDSGLTYSVQLDNIHVDNIAFNKKEIKFLPGTNTARLYIDGFDLNMTIHGKIYALHFIPLSAASLNITNVTMQLDLACNNTDDLNW